MSSLKDRLPQETLEAFQVQVEHVNWIRIEGKMNENSMEYKKSYKKWSNKGKTLNPESLTVNQGRPET